MKYPVTTVHMTENENSYSYDVCYLSEDKKYWITPETESLLLNFNDFNREVWPPGTNTNYPDGCIGIRCDDDFWSAAVLPWKWESATMVEIVKEFWPGLVDKFTTGPDSLDAYIKINDVYVKGPYCESKDNQGGASEEA